jgi:hypothetical protein
MILPTTIPRQHTSMEHICQGMYSTLGLKNNTKRNFFAQSIMETPPKFGHKLTVLIRKPWIWAHHEASTLPSYTKEPSLQLS